MKKLHLIVLTALLTGCVTAQTGEDYTISVNATLKDGSTVRGTLCTERISGATAFMEELQLDSAIVKSLAFTGSNGESKIELVNGDKFSMTVANESFQINSLLGELAIPLANFRSIVLTQRKVSTGEDNGLVFYCTFDDPAAITSPAVGPKGVYLRGSFHDGKSGKALQTTVYAQNATFELPSNFFKTSGCIEFWAKILKTSPYIGNGGDPRLFTITQKHTNKPQKRFLRIRKGKLIFLLPESVQAERLSG